MLIFKKDDVVDELTFQNVNTLLNKVLIRIVHFYL